jgi:hypothetical protein
VHDLIKVSSEFLSFFFLLLIEIKTLSAGHELYS